METEKKKYIKKKKEVLEQEKEIPKALWTDFTIRKQWKWREGDGKLREGNAGLRTTTWCDSEG